MAGHLDSVAAGLTHYRDPCNLMPTRANMDSLRERSCSVVPMALNSPMARKERRVQIRLADRNFTDERKFRVWVLVACQVATCHCSCRGVA